MQVKSGSNIESSQININYEKKFSEKFLKYQEYNLDILNDLNGTIYIVVLKIVYQIWRN